MKNAFWAVCVNTKCRRTYIQRIHIGIPNQESASNMREECGKYSHFNAKIVSRIQIFTIDCNKWINNTESWTEVEIIISENQEIKAIFNPGVWTGVLGVLHISTSV